ncbi:MAG: FtsX-like permease family protein [Bacteroidota bacterium]|nr:FtsX-like permease family protein [Bacteroidota bacterium]
MLRNYIKLTLRNIGKHFSSSLINILGLTIGMTVFVLIAMYVHNEMSFDNFHPKSSQTYRVIIKSDLKGVGEFASSTPCPTVPTLQKEYSSSIKYVGRIFNNWNAEYFIEYKERGFKENNFFFADSTILDIFKIEFIQGNSSEALRKPNTVLITESTAKKYFGDANPIGKRIRFEEKYLFTIEAVIKDAPNNTHFHYNFLTGMTTLQKMNGGTMPTNWYWNPFWSYIVLKENVTQEDFEQQLPLFVSKYFPIAKGEHKYLYLQPIQDIHLNSHLDFEIETNGNKSYVITLSIIALFMLIIAMINYMNLATATAAGRAREIGIKKVLGTQQTLLIIQFLSEAIIHAFISMILALTLIEILLKPFNDFVNSSLEISMLFQPLPILFLIMLSLVTGIISGAYPAFYLAKYHPMNVLKGVLTKGVKSGWLRKALVIIQFSISIALIIGTLYTYKQLSFMRSTDLGFNQENILVIPIARTPVVNKYDSFKKDLLSHPRIQNVTTMEYIIGTDYNSHEFLPEGYSGNQWQFYPTIYVRNDFLEVFDIPLVAENFRSQNNSTELQSMLINESMVKHMGWENNQEAIGKKFITGSGKKEIIGVFADFNAKSLHNKKTPFVLNITKGKKMKRYFSNYIAVKVLPGDIQHVINFIEGKWMEYAPSRPFDFMFLDKELDNLYHDEKKLSVIAAIVTFLSLLIAALGFFGLVSFLTNQRAKELEIRKMLGADDITITKLVAVEFLWLIIISNVIAWPVVYFALKAWLNTFAYHVEMSIFVFLESGLAALVIALVITIIKSISIIRRNPADTLRYE